MESSGNALTQLVLLIGCLILVNTLTRNLMRWVTPPALVGFLLVGGLLRLVDARLELLPARGEEVLQLLAKIGVIFLLFRVGLESKLSQLLKQLSRAWPIWIGNVALSAALGYLTARYALGFALIPSLSIAVALTATSIGVTVSIWEEADRMDTPQRSSAVGCRRTG